jgi:hypothetical protein
VTQERNPTVHLYECRQHGRRLTRSCSECRAQTGFTDAQWDYREAKERGVVLPLALCAHGNIKGSCPAVCSRDERAAKTNGPGHEDPGRHASQTGCQDD